jgi:hypothetical protein
MPNVPGFLSGHVETMKSLRMCENFNFPTLAKSSIAVGQPSGRHRQEGIGQGDEVYISHYRVWTGMRNEYERKNKWTEYYYYYDQVANLLLPICYIADFITPISLFIMTS